MTARRLLGNLVRAIPGGSRALQAIDAHKLRGRSAAEIFTAVYETQAWRCGDTLSGPGSSLAQTAAIRARLPDLFSQLGVSSVLDIPCGDFHWMRTVDLSGIEYMGADIVAELVEDNQRRFGRPGIRFTHLDLTRDALPHTDLVLIRDCLPHLSNVAVFDALRNVTRQGPTYVLSTTLPGHGRNRDIATGQWRPLDLEAPPFRLPEPIALLEERHPDERWRMKALGLWRTSDIALALAG